MQEKLRCEYPDVVLEPFLVVSCMLLMEGADLYIKNRLGHSPLFLSPSHTSHVLTTVVQKCGYVDHPLLRLFFLIVLFCTIYIYIYIYIYILIIHILIGIQIAEEHFKEVLHPPPLLFQDCQGYRCMLLLLFG